MKKKDFKAALENRLLKISATTEQSSEEEDKGYARRKFSYRKFDHSIWMPEFISDEDITAKYGQDVLTLIIPKTKTPDSPSALTIQVQ